ncbi:MAG: DUF4159 domain-containing protein [Proteobacteria bacterium]|nr:DUF4159 domain-containing protein [Pseudomonadota bacterium]
MIFAHPWLLLGLAALPVIWWLVRASPPAPRSQAFPALRLLADLRSTAESPERTPPWLLLLRLLAAACLIVGLAEPILDPGHSLPGRGPLLIVMDDCWASAADWAPRSAAANAAIAAASRTDRPVALLSTAPGPDGRPPAIIGPMTPEAARARVAALSPLPWPADHVGTAHALVQWHMPGTAVLFVDSGLAEAHGETAFRAALTGAGAVTDARAAETAPLLQTPLSRDGHLILRLAAAPQPVDRRFAVLAQGSDGRTLDRVTIRLAAGATEAEAPLGLPTILANSVTRLQLSGVPTAGGTVLLDDQWRRRIVGLASAAGDAADAPLVGPLYYLNRALGPDMEVRHRPLDQLLAQPLSVLILSDRPLPPGPDRDAVVRFVRRGGLLIRFAGPLMAQNPDPLLPVRLLQQDRSLGGALSWNKPEHLAPFPSNSPFAGLPVPKDVTVSRQLLADPASLAGASIWANLTDGTPLVSSAPLGQGRIVLFHVSADADWSSLPLSGLFPAMLDRLVRLSAGSADTGGNARLAPAEIMNGFGDLGSPNAAAAPISAADITTVLPSPKAPPGLYGPAGGRRARNLGGILPAPVPAAAISGAARADLSGAHAERPIGPALVAIALLLLVADVLASLALRGVLHGPGGGVGPGPDRGSGPRRPRLGRRIGRRARTTVVIAALAVTGLAVTGLPLARPAEAAATPVPPCALQTCLAYVVTGNSSVDRLSRDGLASLSDFVTSRSAAILASPVGVSPGQDDLSLYPLLYWPIIPGDAPPNREAIAALNRFMENGGIILIDTEGGGTGAQGSGAGLQPGATAALRQAVAGLVIPPLMRLNEHHVLAHSFYLLRDFPGRYQGAPVWVAAAQDAANDGVSPIIIGSNDWVAAWDMNSDGSFPYATLPGDDQQRLYAYRFGMNLVMYALTGTYKGDQVHVPAILERLGQ